MKKETKEDIANLRFEHHRDKRRNYLTKLGEAIKNSKKDEAKGTANRSSYDATNLDSPQKLVQKLPTIRVSKMVTSMAGPS